MALVPSNTATTENADLTIMDLLSSNLMTSPEKQMSKDEIIARRLQQLELEEAQARPMHRPQNQDRSSQQSNNQNLSPPIGAPRPQSPSSDLFLNGQDTQRRTLYPDSHDPAELAPEAVTPSAPWSPVAVAPIPWRSDNTAPEVVPLSSHWAASSIAPEVVKTSPREITSPKLPLLPTDPGQLSAYLESHRQVPYPSQWILAQVVETLYCSFNFASPSDWLDTIESTSWHHSRCGHARGEIENANFTFHAKAKGGRYRDPQISWTMYTPGDHRKRISLRHSWYYVLKLDLNTNIRRDEKLITPEGRNILCTYVHGLNYDTLRFVGPDGRAYMWVTHGPVTATNGARYDTLRHALFVSQDKNQDPLFGQIVADHTYWDGFTDRKRVHQGIKCAGCRSDPLVGLRWKCRTCQDHNLCEACWISKASIKPSCDVLMVSLPDETLHIRSETVDVALVVATLHIVKEWEKIMLREERRLQPDTFRAHVENIRRGNLGRMSHWKSCDFEGVAR